MMLHTTPWLVVKKEKIYAKYEKYFKFPIIHSTIFNSFPLDLGLNSFYEYIHVSMCTYIRIAMMGNSIENYIVFRTVNIIYARSLLEYFVGHWHTI